MIHNKVVMCQVPEQYEINPDFREFLSREFDHTTANATMEELAKFAFGSIQAAMKAFGEQREKNEN